MTDPKTKDRTVPVFLGETALKDFRAFIGQYNDAF